MDRMIELLDEACKACHAVLEYQAILNKGPGKVTEHEFKAVMRRMFEHARRVEDMRLKNLMDALHCNDSADFDVSMN